MYPHVPEHQRTLLQVYPCQAVLARHWTRGSTNGTYFRSNLPISASKQSKRHMYIFCAQRICPDVEHSMPKCMHPVACRRPKWWFGDDRVAKYERHDTRWVFHLDMRSSLLLLTFGLFPQAHSHGALTSIRIILPILPSPFRFLFLLNSEVLCSPTRSARPVSDPHLLHSSSSTTHCACDASTCLSGRNCATLTW